MANYLITGGLGFIGLNYLKYSLSKNKENFFICLDALTYAANISELNNLSNYNNFKFIKGNICDTVLINKIFEEHKIDYIINFAAETHVDRSIENSYLFYKTNVLGVQALLEACRKYGVKRFHQISTDEVYGDLSLDSNVAFTEESSLKPSNPYSASKASADLLVLAYHRTYGIPVSISRSTNNYGPYQNEEKFIPKIITNALENKSIPVYGTGKNKRDWLYVLDQCEAIDLIVAKGSNGSIYNISGGTELENSNLVKLILNKMNKSSELIEYVSDRPGHDLRYFINNHKITELGWKAKTTMEYGIETTIQYFKNKQN